MKIIIVGGGTVGAAICTHLLPEGHEITVIDRDEATLIPLTNACDISAVVGNGADIAVLRKAGAEKADLLIAVTSGDEVNLLCCSAARKLGTDHTIARVRNPEYTGFMHFMKDEMNLSMTINPELAVAKEIFRNLRFPAAAKIETFSRGRIELVEVVVAPDSPMVGKTLLQLRSSTKIKFLVGCVLRGDKVIIPSGDFVIAAGDTIGVTAGEDEITGFFKNTHSYKRPVRDVLIVGGGRVTYYLAGFLSKARINTTIIEENRELCYELSEAFPSCTVVNDDGARQEVLLEHGLDGANALLALTDSDEKNAIISMYAASRSREKVITLIQKMEFVDFFKGMGLSSIFSPKFTTSTDILRYVRTKSDAKGAEIESLHRIMGGRVEAVEFAVKEKLEGVTGIPLKELRPRPGVLIACIIHRDKIIIPSGDDAIEVGDSVIVLTSGEPMKPLKDMIR